MVSLQSILLKPPWHLLVLPSLLLPGDQEVLHKGDKVISAPSQAALLGDHLGVPFLPVFPTASLSLLVQMMLCEDL